MRETSIRAFEERERFLVLPTQEVLDEVVFSVSDSKPALMRHTSCGAMLAEVEEQRNPSWMTRAASTHHPGQSGNADQGLAPDARSRRCKALASAVLLPPPGSQVDRRSLFQDRTLEAPCLKAHAEGLLPNTSDTSSRPFERPDASTASEAWGTPTSVGQTPQALTLIV